MSAVYCFFTSFPFICDIKIRISIIIQVIHFISLNPISDRSTSKSFHEPSVQLVRIDMIGTFLRTTMREFYENSITKLELFYKVAITISMNCAMAYPGFSRGGDAKCKSGEPTYYIAQFSPKNAMKMKEAWTQKRSARPWLPRINRVFDDRPV